MRTGQRHLCCKSTVHFFSMTQTPDCPKHGMPPPTILLLLRVFAKAAANTNIINLLTCLSCIFADLGGVFPRLRIVFSFDLYTTLTSPFQGSDPGFFVLHFAPETTPRLHGLPVVPGSGSASSHGQFHSPLSNSPRSLRADLHLLQNDCSKANSDKTRVRLALEAYKTSTSSLPSGPMTAGRRAILNSTHLHPQPAS